MACISDKNKKKILKMLKIVFFLAFWVPKNGTSGAQNQNLKPVLEPVTKTDSKTCFRFEF